MKRYGKLDVVEVENGRELCVVLFHGFGADAHDLAPLSDVSSQVKATWIFPNAGLQVPIAPGFMGRAWFHIDVAALDRDLRTGAYRERARTRPAGLDQAVLTANTMLDALPFSRSQIVIGGFSQGAMLATELALSATESFAGLIVLSGTLLDEENWRRKANEKKGLSYFQSHGNHDDLLPLDMAEALNQIFVSADWHGEFVEFRGGHEIPMKVIEKMGNFIGERANQR